jgi:ABC-type lipoprotein export system ATPase subunit
MSESSLYQIEDLHFHYSLGKKEVHALRGVSLEIPKEGVVCLSGPSGSGKTTLLSILGLIEPVQEGKAYFSGQDIASFNEKKRNSIRGHQIGFVFQQFCLMPTLTAFENVEYFLARQGMDKEERRQRVLEALEHVGLLDQKNKKPYEMSGGQQQRVAVARAMAKRPQVIIADEPTASLDQKNGRELMGLFSKLCQERHASVIVASHDPMVQSFCDEMIEMLDGKIVQGASVC